MHECQRLDRDLDRYEFKVVCIVLVIVLILLGAGVVLAIESARIQRDYANLDLRIRQVIRSEGIVGREFKRLRGVAFPRLNHGHPADDGVV